MCINVKQSKDVRSLCLTIISSALKKYEDHDFGSKFWDIFFKAVKPLVDGFKQEGSSSERPSSLFVCFLAMSQSPTLVSHLCREKNLIPDIFSFLSVPTASDAIVDSVFKFIANLLSLEPELGIYENTVKKVLLSNLEGLVNNLHHLFHNNTERKRYLMILCVLVIFFVIVMVYHQCPYFLIVPSFTLALCVLIVLPKQKLSKCLSLLY